MKQVAKLSFATCFIQKPYHFSLTVLIGAGVGCGECRAGV